MKCTARQKRLKLSMKTSVTKITRSRISELLELVRELSRFERLEHEVEATVESLGRALLGPHPVAGALLANCDGRLAGYAIYFLHSPVLWAVPAFGWKTCIYVQNFVIGASARV
jgi:hypothetical protein